jgi:hypothetical protein
MEIAAGEFASRPSLGEESKRELADRFMNLLKDYLPRLAPGTGPRLAERFRELD